jgi:hypothetical protein
MADNKFSKPGDLVYIAPSYAKDRPSALKWVGAAAIVIDQYQDRLSSWPSIINYYDVMIDGKKYMIEVENVQLEPVQQIQNGL